MLWEEEAINIRLEKEVFNTYFPWQILGLSIHQKIGEKKLEFLSCPMKNVSLPPLKLSLSIEKASLFF